MTATLIAERAERIVERPDPILPKSTCHVLTPPVQLKMEGVPVLCDMVDTERDSVHLVGQTVWYNAHYFELMTRN